MRFRSAPVDGLQVFAVTEHQYGLLRHRARMPRHPARAFSGFARRADRPTEGERYFVHGFQVFNAPWCHRCRSENTDVSSRSST